METTHATALPPMVLPIAWEVCQLSVVTGLPPGPAKTARRGPAWSRTDLTRLLQKVPLALS